MLSAPETESFKNRATVGQSGFSKLSWLLCVVCGLMAAHFAHAQLVVPGVVVTRSRSEQFIIYSRSSVSLSPMVANLQRNTNFVRLDPSLLTVSCERIKQLLWRDLGASDNWSGKVFLHVYPVNSPDDPVRLTSERFRDRWQYELSLPSIVERARYARSIVRVLLLEYANRNAAEHSAELPLWLVEGLSEQLLRSSELEIILPPPEQSQAGILLSSLIINARKENPLQQAHSQLCATQPLSFQQLSWPDAAQLDQDAGKLYSGSAQLFVTELLRLPDGQASLRAMLAALPRFYNWQFAFLDAFHAHFQRPLDIEKWWSLHLTHFTGRQLAQTWTLDESCQELDQILRSAVDVHLDTNDLPLTTQIPLQTLIREWERPRQIQVLETKLTELEAAHLRVAPELLPLVEDYSQTLAAYLHGLGHVSSSIVTHKRPLTRRTPHETLLHLDELDAQRAALKPTQKTAPLVQAESAPKKEKP